MAAEEDVGDVTMNDGEAEEEENGGKEAEEEDEEDESDSESESSDSDDGENENTQLIKQLESDIAANKYNYDAYVKLISCLRKCALLEKLRATREAMNLHYPLTPTMWSEWAQDEARLVATQEDACAVEALYERGVQEYQSVVLWLDYIEFTTKHAEDSAQASIEKQAKKRRLFERALAAVGLHYVEGGRIWKAFREMENNLLLKLEGTEKKMKQVETVRSVFHRQLTIPSTDLAETLNEYKVWEEQQGVHIGDESDELAGAPDHVSSAYRKALQMSASREPLEDKIAKDQDGSAEQLQLYMDYITMEEATGEPARIQVIYERTITAFPVNHDVWIRYTEYLEKNLKVAPVLKSVYARAVRNCPWVEALWKNYLLTLERSHATESEIAAVFQQSLLGGFLNPEEFLDLHLTRADGLRRRIMTMEDNPERQSFLALLHDAFDGGSQFMSTVFPDYVDRSLQLHAYWAHTEAHLAKDLAAARGVWENLIKTSGWMTEVWQGYISMELSLKNVKEARSIYRNCYSRRLEGNGTQVMCYAWLRFEREHGTLEDYDRAWTKVGPRLAEVQSMQVQQEINVSQSIAQVNKNKDQVAKVSRKSKVPSESGAGKRKRLDDSGFKEPKPVLKRPKPSEEDESSKMVKQKGKLENAPEVPASGSKEDIDADHVPAEITKETSKLYTDECTAFLKNLSFEITEDELREFFSSVSGVKEVRLLRDKMTGQQRGLAYVEFEDEESLAAAVAKDGQELGGRTVRIARSAPTKGGRGGSSAGRGGRGGSGQRGGRKSGGGRSEHIDENGSGGRGGRGARPGVGLGHRRGGKVGLTGNTTFAVPRAVARPLGWGSGQASTGDETPKSNEEFRKMLLANKS